MTGAEGFERFDDDVGNGYTEFVMAVASWVEVDSGVSVGEVIVGAKRGSGVTKYVESVRRGTSVT